MFCGSPDEIEEVIKNAEETLAKAKQYFDENGLLINTKKTQILFVGNNQLMSQVPNDIKIKVDNYITPSKEVKNLGLYMDRYVI